MLRALLPHVRARRLHAQPQPARAAARDARVAVRRSSAGRRASWRPTRAARSRARASWPAPAASCSRPARSTSSPTCCGPPGSAAPRSCDDAGTTVRPPTFLPMIGTRRGDRRGRDPRLLRDRLRLRARSSCDAARPCPPPLCRRFATVSESSVAPPWCLRNLTQAKLARNHDPVRRLRDRQQRPQPRRQPADPLPRRHLARARLLDVRGRAAAHRGPDARSAARRPRRCSRSSGRSST